jgi:hypothetical protein
MRVGKIRRKKMNVSRFLFAGGFLGSLGVAFLAGAWAQDKAVEHGQPNLWHWPDSMDSVNAAPKNHKVLFENDHVRLLEVTVQPGETENMHGHKYPSVFMMDAPQPRIKNHNLEDEENAPNGPLGGKDERRPPQRVDGNVQYPICRAMPTPQAPHQVTILDSFPQHFYRMEFKKVEGDSIKRLTKYPAD